MYQDVGGAPRPRRDPRFSMIPDIFQKIPLGDLSDLGSDWRNWIDISKKVNISIFLIFLHEI